MQAGTGAEITVELLGQARLLGGAAHIRLQLAGPATLRSVVAALAERSPALVGPVLNLAQLALADGHIFNLNGRDFLRSPDAPLRSGDRLLLLSSASGG